MVRELNQQFFPRDSLADDAYVATAGRLSAGILYDIRSQMAAKFPTFTLLLPLPQPTAAAVSGIGEGHE